MLLSLSDLNINTFLPQVVWKRPKFKQESYSRCLGEIPPMLQAWLLLMDQTFIELGPWIWTECISPLRQSLFRQETTFLALWRGIKVYLDHTLLNPCSLQQSICWTHSDLINSCILYVGTSLLQTAQLCKHFSAPLANDCFICLEVSCLQQHFLTSENQQTKQSFRWHFAKTLLLA